MENKVSFLIISEGSLSYIPKSVIEINKDWNVIIIYDELTTEV